MAMICISYAVKCWTNFLVLPNLHVHELFQDIEVLKLLRSLQQAVFVHTIRPMLTSVTMHPLLVTHSRDLEKGEARWKKMELHDVIVESSRFESLENSLTLGGPSA